MMVSNDMPGSEKSTERLKEEALLFFVAGSFNVWSTMSTITFHLLSNPAMKSRLQEELKKCMANYPHRIPHRTELEKLPYMTAVVKEGLQ